MPFAGCTVNKSQYTGAQHQIDAANQFDTNVGQPLALSSEKVYFGDGSYPATVAAAGGSDPTRYQALITAGCQLVLCYKPPFKGLPGTTYPADRSAMATSAAAFQAAATAAGAPAPKVVLWQEPQNGQFGMSASQCQQMFAYYYGAISALGLKVIYDSATHTPSAITTYYPGAAFCDEVMADFYGSTYNKGTRVDGLLAQATTDGKPFGFGELGSSLNATVPPASVIRAYLNYVIGIMAAQVALGKASDAMWFNGLGNNWNTINSSGDFRVALLLALWAAMNPIGPPPPPPVPQPLVPSSATSVTYGPPGALDALMAAAGFDQGSVWPSGRGPQHVAFDSLLGTVLMPNPQTIPATLTLVATPPLIVPGGVQGQVLTSDANGNVTLAPVGAQLTPTAVLTSNYTASPGDLAIANITSASITVTLPNAPANGAIVGVKLVATGGANTVTVQRAGTDTIDVAGGPTAVVLATIGQSVLFQYSAAIGVWYRWAGHLWFNSTGDLFYGNAIAGIGATPAILPAPTAGTIPYLLTSTPSGGLAQAPAWAYQNREGVFGDGSDGAVTFDGSTTILGMVPSASTYTMTRDIFCAAITINNGVTLVPAGWRIFCTGTLTNNGTISAAGGAGGATGASGTGTGSGSLSGGKAGAAGQLTNGNAGNSVNSAGLNTAGAGGNGASGTGGAAGTAGSSGTSWFKTPEAALAGVLSVLGTQTSLTGGPSGGSGAGDNTNKGGGGGGGGGPVVIFAWAVNNGSGTINASGGAGGTPTLGNTGGGGGGAGGVILVYTLAAWTAGTTNVTGGAAGGHAGSGTSGTAGGNGTVLNQVLT